MVYETDKPTTTTTTTTTTTSTTTTTTTPTTTTTTVDPNQCKAGPGRIDAGLDVFVDVKCGEAGGDTMDRLSDIDSLAKCERRCLTRTKCMSVSYKASTKKCHLLDRKYDNDYAEASDDGVVANRIPP